MLEKRPSGISVCVCVCVCVVCEGRLVMTKICKSQNMHITRAIDHILLLKKF